MATQKIMTRAPRLFAAPNAALQFLSIALAIVCALCAAAAAQVTTATVIGTVSDASGAVLANAQVEAVNTDTNLTRATQTNSHGEYRIEFLPVGTYKVEAGASGFTKSSHNGITLDVNQTARVDIALKAGQVGETIEVNDAPPLINTATSELGRTVENEEIKALPLVNRNVYALLDLTPGVQSNQNSIVLGYPEQRTMINGGVDGGAGSVNYYLDGGTNMTHLRNTGNILPNPDAIQEFRVQTNAYSAEYGHFASGIVNVLTKSGTNKFHGSAFEFLRNTILNANDWGSTLPTPAYHRNQFGATIGGPIKKDKTFFFGSYSGLRQNAPQFLGSAIVPTAAERSGDFSQSVIGGKPIFLKDPLLAGTCSAAVTTACFKDPTRATASNPTGLNIIPAGRRDLTATNILNGFIPVSNAPGNIWQGFVPNPYQGDDFLIKVDHSLTDNQRLTVSYFNTSGNNIIQSGGIKGGTSNTPNGNLPWSTQQFNWRQQNANASDTWTLNPHIVNQTWLVYTRNFAGRLNLPQTALSDLGSSFTGQGTPSLPQITVSGLFTLGQSIAGPLAGGDFYSARDVVSYTTGRHSFKFGGELSLDKDIQQTLLNNYGVFTFNGGRTTDALADFEIGIPSAVSQDAPVTAYTDTWSTSFFAEDDFRVLPRFTLNLGLRWELQTPPVDPADRESTYIAGVQSTVNPAAPIGLLFPGDQGLPRGIAQMKWNHLSPRIGFAWDPWGDGKTSIRGGMGIFYGSTSGNEWNTTSNFEPFAIRLTFTNVASTTGATLSNPYRNFVGGNPFPYHGTFVNGGSIFGPAPNFDSPYTYQTNFSVQRQITSDLSLTVAYVGSLSRRLPFAFDLNYPVLTAAATTANVQTRRANAAFGSVLSMQSNQTASYNGLQASIQKRMGHHFSVNGFYTWSKTLDSVELQNSTSQGGVQDVNNVRGDKGRADTDQRHVVVASANWDLSYYNGKSALWQNVINGWSISPILKIHSGLPFTVLNGIDANLDGASTDRAQITGVGPYGIGQTPAHWFNTAAFSQNAAVTGVAVDGNSPRNFLTAPAFRDLDLAISRKFKLAEDWNLEFRGEATNTFNHPNLSSPGNTVNSASFGIISTAGTMRQLQLGLRLTF